MAFPTTSTVPSVSVPTESSYKGHPVLTLPCPGDATKPGIQMGVKKLKAVLTHLEAVKAFVAKHDKPAASGVDAKLAALTKLLEARGVSAAEISAMLKA